MNNPFRYTDPSGEFWHMIIGAAIGGIMNLATNWKNADNFWQGLGYFGIGAAAGAIGAGIGGGMSSAIAGGGFGAGFWGTSAALNATTSFGSGALIGASSGLSSGFISGTGNGLMQGNGWNSLVDGLKYGAIGTAGGALIGGIAGGINAVNDGRNFWHGGRVINEASMGLSQMNQLGELDCRYEVFRSNDLYYNSSTDDVSTLRSNFPNVEINDKQLSRMYSNKNLSLYDQTSEIKGLSKAKIAESIIDNMSNNKATIYEMLISKGMRHATVITIT